MKRIQRLTLSPKAVRFLAGRSSRVAAAPDPRTEARRLWNLQANQAFREIREALGKMASGLERCMYCEDSEGTAIEHFWPKATYPERAFDWLNYLIACSQCNSNFKRDQFPLDGAGAPLLVKPERGGASRPSLLLSLDRPVRAQIAQGSSLDRGLRPQPGNSDQRASVCLGRPRTAPDPVRRIQSRG
jgi:5-methylcytosine-specific restriction endonuclease McrA